MLCGDGGAAGRLLRFGPGATHLFCRSHSQARQARAWQAGVPSAAGRIGASANSRRPARQGFAMAGGGGQTQVYRRFDAEHVPPARCGGVGARGNGATRV